jgi:hypothetical protein
MDIKEILDQIMQLNITQAVYTTYDKGVADSVRAEIVRKLADLHGCVYHYQPPQNFKDT